MTLGRRQFLGGAAAFTLLGQSGVGFAQAYPAKPIKLVVPFAAGGSTDLLARIVAQKLAGRLGQMIK